MGLQDLEILLFLRLCVVADRFGMHAHLPVGQVDPVDDEGVPLVEVDRAGVCLGERLALFKGSEQLIGRGIEDRKRGSA